MSPHWEWEQTDAGRSGSSGDLSKVFRHEPMKTPGILAFNAPDATATLMAREVIQNSWDAARELQAEDASVPDFAISFDFGRVHRHDKSELAQRLDLAGLAERVLHLKRRDVGLAERDILTDFAHSDELSTLQIVEESTTGMYGPFHNAKSKMFYALVSLGYTEKGGGAGGSYGYGKAGLIRGSAIRTVVAYTCFRERADDPHLTRRLLGMTYWGQHDLEDASYTGFARFGHRRDDGSVFPYENEEADRIAADLAIPVRDPSNPRDLGTTFLLVDPTVDPMNLTNAISRSWWPALVDGAFSVTISPSDGTVWHPRPKRDENLRAFVRGYEIATTPQDNEVEQESRTQLSSITVEGTRFDRPGTVGLVADMGGWSYANQTVAASDDPSVDHKSLIALVRSPRMVVEYLVAGHSVPYVRGTFVAGDSVDEQLRLTEPKGHDAWQTDPSAGDLDRIPMEVADHVLRRVKAAVSTFRNRLKPELPPREDVHLPVFDQLMRRIMSGGGSGVPTPEVDTRPVVIRLDHRRRAAPDGRLALEGSASFGLSEHHEGESATLRLSVVYKFLEDGSAAGAGARLTLEPAPGVRVVSPGVFEAEITRPDEITIGFTSEPYPSEWTGRLIVNADVVDEPAST